MGRQKSSAEFNKSVDESKNRFEPNVSAWVQKIFCQNKRPTQLWDHTYSNTKPFFCSDPPQFE